MPKAKKPKVEILPSENFKELLENLTKTDFETNQTSSGKITIRQSQRNELRRVLIEKFYAFLIAEGIDCYLTDNGVVIAIENENIGTISIENKMTIKSLDFDPQEAADIFELENNSAEKN